MRSEMLTTLNAEQFYSYVKPAFGGQEMPMFWLPYGGNNSEPTTPVSEWIAGNCDIEALCITNDWDTWTEDYYNSL